ncbi:MAG: adenylate kinase family protein [Thermoplasmata archaeon]|nr:adenylate kinase family protein [Thermoplasmata archaeon]
MKVAITGTPGVGKTSVAEELKKHYEVIHLADLVDRFAIGYDEERDSKIVDEEAMNEYIKNMEEKDILIVEGHLSHFMDVDAVVVLRCHPEELKKRLAKKGWSEKKMRENLEAEALDIVLERALEKHERVWEVETTGKEIKEVSEEVKKIIDEMPPPNYGKIDYSEWLMENA